MQAKDLIILCIFTMFTTLFPQAQVFVDEPDVDEVHWIRPPAEPNETGVYHFRQSFQLSELPDSFVVHVTADNRYRLFVNNVDVCHGPARDDLQNWQFESLEISDLLRPGQNTIAAVVWNAGPFKPAAQLSNQTAFWLVGLVDDEPVLQTDSTWRVQKNMAIHFFRDETIKQFPAAVGPGEQVRIANSLFGWQKIEFDDSAWPYAENISLSASGSMWHLRPRTIPFMQETEQRFARIRRSRGVALDEEFLSGNAELTIPPQTNASILIDQNHLTIAYPELAFSGGNGAQITITYNEALFDSSGKKGHRDSVNNRVLKGLYDVVYPDGGNARLFRPLWYRAFRYVELQIENADEPLVLHDFTSDRTGYPLAEHARFISNDASLQNIWHVAWRTARCCAHETYMDCPYYEQLQYGGDTRIQALISLAVSGDDRLMRQAIQQFYQSRQPDGLTLCAYPSNTDTRIPPFSLIWISMLHDHWQWRGDTDFIRPYQDGIHGVLAWFETHLQNGFLTDLPDDSWDRSKNWRFDHWHYVDDTPGFPIGVPPGVYDGQSTLVTLMYVYALQHAADLMQVLDDTQSADRYQSLANDIKIRLRETSWNAERQLLADTPKQQHFSQHTNTMAVLVDLFAPEEQPVIMQRVLEDSSLVQASLYFSFYVHRAMVKAGLGDRYLERMQLWQKMLDLGFTTFPEHPGLGARSDCHAWSAHPLFDFLTTVAGIQPGTPGFETVRIAPHLGPLNEINVTFPHPVGHIRLHLQETTEGLQADVDMPDHLTGTLEWGGQEKTLVPGTNRFKIER